ncbi:MAG: FIST C-terminal domain-containing protein [Bacteroidia bacterium]|nr:FIST C-terminal domain-containing protein [Bacteroidia bacterium]
MTALGIMAIKGPANEFAIIHRSDLTNNDPFITASLMAQELKDINPNINLIQFLPSWVGWDPHDRSADGIKKIFGKNIPVCGGVSVDNSKGITSFHFLDDQVVERGAVMIGFADSTLKIISKVCCGYGVIEGMQFEVTRSEGNRIYELNHKPAWQQYTSALGLPETIYYVEAFIVAAFGIELPVTFHQEYGSKHILFAPVKNNGDGSFNAGMSCPIGTKLYLTRRDEKLMFESVDNMVNKVLTELNGTKPVAVFHADCALRGKLSLNRILKDELMNRMQSPIRQDENVPWLGFYGGGEYGMLGGDIRFHQFSSAITVLYR